MNLAALPLRAGVIAVLATTVKSTSLPTAIAGQMVGSIGNTVVVAGGSRWSAPPSEGGKKIYEDSILAFSAKSNSWKRIGALPRPLAYGAAVAVPNGLVFAGGQDGDHLSREVFFVSMNEETLITRLGPLLPAPLTNLVLTRLGNKLFAFGGQESAVAASTRRMWSLSLDPQNHPLHGWHEEPQPPLPDRILASGASCADRFFIAGGAQLVPNASGAMERRYLRDAWSFDLTHGWQKLTDLPHPVLAAPAVCSSTGTPILFGGDDGHMAGILLPPGELHPGFSRIILGYNHDQQRWDTIGELPVGLVTTGATRLPDGSVVIPGGEDRPGNRSSEVLLIQLSRQD